MSTDKFMPTRRDLAKLGLGLGSAAFLGGNSNASEYETSPRVSVRKDGKYETVPLGRASVNITLVQSRLPTVDVSNPQPGIKNNLQHMLDLFDQAQDGEKQDVVMFHELPLTALSFDWDRKQVQKVCIEVPGEETEVLSKKAREAKCYIIFGAYVRDKDWPDHTLSITTIIGPDGEIVDRQWKVRNIKGIFGDIELMTTTVYNVYDQYVEMYGADRVLPVARTPIGNISTTAAQREPELVRGFALKGCEILLRTATGAFKLADIQSSSIYNGIYQGMVNNSYLPENKDIMDRRWSGEDTSKPKSDSTSVWSLFTGPGGEILSQAKTAAEEFVRTTIPIAQFREQHSIPLVHRALYEDVEAAYVPRYQPSLYSDYLPSSSLDAGTYLKSKSSWIKR